MEQDRYLYLLRATLLADMSAISAESRDDTWRLPERYKDLPPSEQTASMRGCILNFLEKVERATLSEIVTAIGAPYEPTVRRQIQQLSATQQLYVDPIGRDPVYFRNGRLAHPTLQSNIPAGLSEYAVRTYNDPLTGKYVTVTEFSRSSLGELKAKGGIHVDLADLPTLVAQLGRILTSIDSNPSLLEPGMATRTRGRKSEGGKE